MAYARSTNEPNCSILPDWARETDERTLRRYLALFTGGGFCIGILLRASVICASVEAVTWLVSYFLALRPVPYYASSVFMPPQSCV